MITINKFLLIIYVISGCGSVSLDEKRYIKIKMLGALVVPDGAEGEHFPSWQEYTLESVTMGPDPETAETITLTSGETESFKIIGRPQVIFQKEIPDTWVDKTFDSFNITFASAVKAAGKYEDDYALTLSNSDISLAESFTVEKGQGITVTIRVNWKNTVTRNDADASEEFSEPSFTTTAVVE